MATLTTTQFREAVDQAGRAPSMHNTQPWVIARAGDLIELRADPDRALPVADSAGRATRLACGAALLNLRLALWAAGWHTRTVVLPDAGRPELLARLSPAPGPPMPPAERALAEAIRKRHSSRTPFFDTPVPATHRTALVQAALEESASLVLVEDQLTLTDVGDLIKAADTVLNERAGYLDELNRWLRAAPDAVDGIAGRAAGPAPALTETLTRRDFGGKPAHENRRYEPAPLVGVLCSLGDAPRDQLTAGQALQRVLLRATSLGLSCSMFSQPVEEPTIREQLRARVSGLAVPQLVVRIGYGAPAPASGRRPVDQIIGGDAESDVRT